MLRQLDSRASVSWEPSTRDDYVILAIQFVKFIFPECMYKKKYQYSQKLPSILHENMVILVRFVYFLKYKQTFIEYLKHAI